ncbi:hypothetical protein Emed_002701 [Eimeria media]
MYSLLKLFGAAALCAAVPTAVICSEELVTPSPEPPKEEVARLIQHPLGDQDLDEAPQGSAGMDQAGADIREHDEAALDAGEVSSHAEGAEESAQNAESRQDETPVAEEMPEMQNEVGEEKQNQ